MHYRSGKCISVSEVYQEWITAVANRVKESSYSNYRNKFEKHIIPEFGDTPCIDITAGKINAYINKKLAEGLSASYVRDLFTVFKSMLLYAQEAKKLLSLVHISIVTRKYCQKLMPVSITIISSVTHLQQIVCRMVLTLRHFRSFSDIKRLILHLTVEAVAAGFNNWHDVNECAGYVLTFENGSSVYVTGDTSKTDQMSEMSSMNIDYAFYCCDGEFNMGLDEAAECARLVGAKHNIPYHNTTDTSGDHFDREKAQQFDAPNRLTIEPNEEIELVHEG